MIRITYAPAQAELAETISADIAADLDPAHPLLIVLLTQQASGDAYVGAELERALQRGDTVVPLLLDQAPLPETLRDFRALDFRSGYDAEALRGHLNQVARTNASIRRSNRRALVVIGGIAALMFAVAIFAISGGLVAFPVDEYNEEATLQAQWIDGMIGATLEYVQPRTTADAQSFAATYEAAPTRLRFYIRGTATASAGAG